MLNILKDLETLSKSLTTCHKKNCTKQFTASQKEKEDIAKKTQFVLKDLTEKKITPKEFVNKMQKLKVSTITSQENRNLTDCALEKCAQQVKTLLEFMIKLLEYDCSQQKNKQSCAKLKEARTILNKKKMSIDDNISFIQLFQ